MGVRDSVKKKLRRSRAKEQRERESTLNPKIQNNIAGPAIAQWLTRKNSETTMISVGIVEKAAFGQLIL